MATSVWETIASAALWAVVVAVLIGALGLGVCAVALAVALPINSVYSVVMVWPTMTLSEVFGYAAGVLFPSVAFLAVRQVRYWKASIKHLKMTVHRVVEHYTQKERNLTQRISELERAAEAERLQHRDALAGAVATKDAFNRAWEEGYSALCARSNQEIAGLRRQVTEQADGVRLARAQHHSVLSSLRKELSAEAARGARLRGCVNQLTGELAAHREIGTRLCGTVAAQGAALAELGSRCAALEQQLAECRRAAAELRAEHAGRPAELHEAGGSGPPGRSAADVEAPDPGEVTAAEDPSHATICAALIADSTVLTATGFPVRFFSPLASGCFTLLIPGAGEAFAGLLGSRLALAPCREADPAQQPAPAGPIDGGFFQAECPCEGCAAHYPDSHYGVLGVPRTASTKEITSAYLRLAPTVHPDKPGGSARGMQQLAEAAEVLRDPRRRRQYDSKLRYWCDEEFKELMKSLKFASVTVPSGGRVGLAFTKQGDFPAVRAVQAGSPADEAGLGRYVGRPVAFVCMKRVAGWTGRKIHQEFAGRRIVVLHFWG